MTTKTASSGTCSLPPAARSLTPGAQYVAEFLADALDATDGDWVAEAIDAENLVVCPRCQFVRLPHNPFRIGSLLQRQNPGIDATSCEVCAMVTEAVKFDMVPASLTLALGNAPDDLACQRAARAVALYDYWISALNGADALVMDAMRSGIDAAGLPMPPAKPEPESH